MTIEKAQVSKVVSSMSNLRYYGGLALGALVLGAFLYFITL